MFNNVLERWTVTVKAYKSFQGAVSEIITPFTNQKLDEDLLEREVDFQIQSGIAGLFANGLASEGLLMSLEERIRVAKIVVDKVSGVIPVMANITAQNTQEGVWLAEQYANLGADALCITQPMVYGFTQPALYEHFSAILCATDLPVCIYNAPQSGNILAPQTVAKLFLEHGNAHYYKESTIDIVHIQNTMRLIGDGADYQFLSGSDASTLAILQLGGKGIISLISAVFPKPIIDLCDAWFSGDKELAKQRQFAVLAIRDALKTGPFMAGYKYAAELAGVPMGSVRAPLANLSDAEKEKIKKSLQTLQLI